MPDKPIVPMTAAHLPACAAIFAEAFRAPPWEDEWSQATAERHLDSILRTPYFMGFVYLDPEPAGFLMGHIEPWYNGDIYLLREMAVAPARQRKGIGQALLDHLTAALRERDIGRIYLLTVNRSPAMTFYRKHGFGSSGWMVVMGRGFH